MEYATGAIVAPETHEEMISQARLSIDEIDDEIIELLKERQRKSARVRRTKKRLGQPAVDLKREADIINGYRDALGSYGPYVAAAILAHSKGVGHL